LRALLLLLFSNLRHNILLPKNILRIYGVKYNLNMSNNKKELEKPGPSTEKAKELELDR
jgi:hypothetical protein